jgi:hypothetical protein
MKKKQFSEKDIHLMPMFSRNGKATDNAYLPIVKLKQMQRVVSNKSTEQKAQVQPERQMVTIDII